MKNIHSYYQSLIVLKKKKKKKEYWKKNTGKRTRRKAMITLKVYNFTFIISTFDIFFSNR